MTWGSPETLAALESHKENFGGDVPALDKKPVLSPQNEMYKEAFYILSSGRQNTDHVINPITFSEVMAYCDCVYELDGYERLRYWAMLSHCDTAWIVAMLEKRKVENAKVIAKTK